MRAVVERAVSGEPGMLLLHGEAGIGKTSLVREAAAAAGSRRGATSCSASASASAPTSPATSPSRRPSPSGCGARAATASTALLPTGSLDDLVPALSDPSGGLALLQIGDGHGRASRATGRRSWWSTTCNGPTPAPWTRCRTWLQGSSTANVWPSSRTYRDTDLDEGHRLHGWLADTLRMPSVAQAALGRMDAWTMEELVLARGGPGAVPGLAEEVLRRSGGNPYLADLLIGESRVRGPGRAATRTPFGRCPVGVVAPPVSRLVVG